MMKKNLNPTASNRETEAMIRYALVHTDQLTPQERQRVVDYLGDKIVDGLPLEAEEAALVSKLPEFRPDEDPGDVWMGDYVDQEEMAMMEYGYNIYNEEETLQSLRRARENGRRIGRREADMIRRLHGLDVHDAQALDARLAALAAKERGDGA